MAKVKPGRGKTSKRKVLKKPKRKKKLVGITIDPVKKKKYKRRKVKGITELRRYKKQHTKAGQVKSVSMILFNKRRKDDMDSLDKFADDIQNDTGFFSKLNKIFYRNKIKVKVKRKWKLQSLVPFTAVVIVEQKDRDFPSQFHYEPYFMAPPATKENIRNHTINTIRNHAELVRQKIIARGIFRQGRNASNYEFSTFKPWYVPSIRIELLYE